MTDEQLKAYEWSKNQSYTSVAAQYAKQPASYADAVTSRSPQQTIARTAAQKRRIPMYRFNDV